METVTQLTATTTIIQYNPNYSVNQICQRRASRQKSAEQSADWRATIVAVAFDSRPICG